MNLQIAKQNWKNFFRGMVGMQKSYAIKIERTEEAKKFPLLAVKKDGDVGYDLPSVKDVTIKACTPSQMEEYQYYQRMIDKMRNSDYRSNAIKKSREATIEELEKKALECLPRTIIPTGIKLEMPNNIWCTINARSSASKKMIITPDSIIDAGYRGELFAVVFNIGYEDLHIKAGDRIAQVIFHERVLVDIEEVDKVSPSERGESGFGSTGN